MDRLKKESLLELCEAMDLRLQVQSAHIECGGTTRALALNAKLREEVDFLKLNLQSESISVGSRCARSAQELNRTDSTRDPLVPLSRTPTITRKTLP